MRRCLDYNPSTRITAEVRKRKKDPKKDPFQICIFSKPIVWDTAEELTLFIPDSRVVILVNFLSLQEALDHPFVGDFHECEDEPVFEN